MGKEAAAEKVGRFVVENQVSRFAYYLSAARGLGEQALNDDEVLAELAARGVDRRQIVELVEKADTIHQAFYNDPKPA